MPEKSHLDVEIHYSEDMEDIITAVPSWLLKWGVSIVFGILLFLVTIASLIRYPDIVKADLKIDSPNSPKPIVSKISGKLIKIMITDNQTVKAGATLAYLESIGNHVKILKLLKDLKAIQKEVVSNQAVNELLLTPLEMTQLGEIQSSYQIFFQSFLDFKSSINNGYLVKRKKYLLEDLNFLTKQHQELGSQKMLKEREFDLATEEFNMHKKLEQQHVETSAEFRDAESKYLSKKSPLLDIESDLNKGVNEYQTKEKEIMELDNQIRLEKEKFLQALNSLISLTEEWKSKYILTASQSGKVTFAGIIQENQILTPGQEVFYINPGNEQFFGSISIPQDNMGKVKQGQKVLIKLKSYPFEEYGIIRGKITYISDVPIKDSIFISKVSFSVNNLSHLKKAIHLKQGMVGDAEIITQDATVIQRINRSFLKMAESN